MSPEIKIRKTVNSFTFLCISMISILLVWNAMLNINNFENQQQELAERSVTAAANEIELLISGYKRSIDIFADENAGLIGAVASSSPDSHGYTDLRDKIVRYFPEYFTFTIADDSGVTLLEGYEGLVGKRCRRDIDEFTTGSGDHQVYVHPGPENIPSHFDIMSHWRSEKTSENVFFVSFKTGKLERILDHTQVAGHCVLLVSTADPARVEVVHAGNRAILTGESQLSPDNVARISHSLPVPGTRWSAAVLPDRHLYRKNIYSILRQSLVVLMGFLVIIYIARMVLLDEQAGSDSSR